MARDRASNTLRQAQNLTLTSSTQVLKDFVGNTDLDDLYRFRLGDRSNVELRLSQIAKSAKVDLEVYQLKGKQANVLRRIGNIKFSDLKPSIIKNSLTRVARTVRQSGAEQVINRSLDAGIYYLRIHPRAGKSTYALTLSKPGMGSNPSGVAIRPDLSTWTRVGDANFTATPTPSVTLTNARAGDDPANVGNLNVSGVEPLTAFDIGSQNFAQAIGITSDQLDQGISNSSGGTLGYQEGSAIRNTAIAANAGDTFRFNWNFSVKDTIDVGFVKVGSTLFRLEGTAPFSYTFPATGVYDIAIGVVDVSDFSGSSILQITS